MKKRRARGCSTTWCRDTDGEARTLPPMQSRSRAALLYGRVPILGYGPTEVAGQGLAGMSSTGDIREVKGLGYRRKSREREGKRELCQISH